MLLDSKKNIYLELENIRVTYVRRENRDPNSDWPNTDVIRIQSYKNEENKSLHLGAELPIESEEKLVEFLSVLRELYDNRMLGRD